MDTLPSRAKAAWGSFPLLRALRHRDFRILWLGAFFSFMGGQIQAVAQGYWVYEVTGNKTQLAMVMLCFNLPVMIFAPFTGIIADRFDRRMVLLFCLSVLTLSATVLAVLYKSGHLEYWHVLASAAINGMTQTVEAPTRQSVVRICVGDEDLPAAIPAQAMTFNLARIIGPAIGGIVLKFFGVFPCFVVNALSFSCLAISVLAIKADLRPTSIDVGGIKDLVLEGFRFTFSSPPLRTLFFMEAATTVFGTFYISLLPAIVKSQLGLDEIGLGIAQSSIGIGAMLGLLFLSVVADRPIKALLTRLAMTSVAVCIFTLGFVSWAPLAYPLLGLIGASIIMQYNTTNTLFQLMSPEALRGRVIAMHLWAIGGVAPIGIAIFGLLAEKVSLNACFWIGGSVLAAVSIWAWSRASLVPEMAKVEKNPGAA